MEFQLYYMMTYKGSMHLYGMKTKEHKNAILMGITNTSYIFLFTYWLFDIILLVINFPTCVVRKIIKISFITNFVSSQNKK